MDRVKMFDLHLYAINWDIIDKYIMQMYDFQDNLVTTSDSTTAIQ